MLVFVDARPRHAGVREVHYGISLVVRRVGFNFLEMNRSVGQATFGMGKEGIKWAGVDQPVRAVIAGPVRLRGIEELINSNFDIGVVQDTTHNFRVTLLRDALKSFLVVIVIVVEADRQALED